MANPPWEGCWAKSSNHLGLAGLFFRNALGVDARSKFGVTILSTYLFDNMFNNNPLLFTSYSISRFHFFPDGISFNPFVGVALVNVFQNGQIVR